MGIRTPWTLESEEVWSKTHRFAGRLFVVGSVVGIIGTLIGVSYPLLFALILLISILPVVYSFFVYKQGRRLL